MNQGVRPKYIDEYECSGPRPPVPGQESQISKMTEGGAFERFERNHHSASLASYSKWNTLTGLLEDAEGLKLFKKYVERDAKVEDSARLDFYIICEGLKLYQDESQARSCILAIYNKYIHKGRIQISISNTDSSFKLKLHAIKSNKHAPDIHVFDLLQQEAFRLLNETAFQNFLQSDDYIEHIANVTGTQAGCTSSSSGSGSAQLASRSALPTLVEDQELSIQGDDISQTGEGTPMRLTKELLLSTQRRRLEARPPATHGYSVYNTCASFNTVSRQDSERQSCSSGGGGKSDSDTMSITSSRDGRSHVQRRQNSHEKLETIPYLNAYNPETDITPVLPRTLRPQVREYKKLSTEDFVKELRAELEKVRRGQEIERQLIHTDPTDGPSRPPPLPSKNPINHGPINHGQLVADLKRFALEEDNDQSILDQHVSRVWADSPHRSPGTVSPCTILPSRRRAHDLVTTGGDIGHSMRHSRSMPDHAPAPRRLTHKWASMNTDSGISLTSMETTLRPRDSNSRSRSTINDSHMNMEEVSRRLEDESRRFRRHSQHPTGAAAAPFESTVAVYTYLDEELPYRSKLPGSRPTLRQFKEYLPKKGNFRFFFKTACEDPDNPIIQEEIVNDDEILPLFEGKVMGLVKPFE